MIQDFATPEATKNYTSRFLQAFQAGHFREVEGLFLSSIGLGTYLGEMDDDTDRISYQATEECIVKGINVVDSAINYRGQHSERVIGKVISDLIQKKKLSRKEIFISTKGGFIPFDGNYPNDPPSYFQETYLQTGILKIEDVVQGCHAMTPRYLEDQLTRSLKNLGLAAIDLYYVHNPETQLEEVGEDEFYDRLTKAFELLEEKVSEGKIRMYGTATWNGYRLSPEARGYLSLEKVLEAAKRAGGAKHHFKAVQLPYNLGMPEALAIQNQMWEGETVSTVEFARRSGLMVFTSASLFQGRLARGLPDKIRSLFPGYPSHAVCSLQFVRSTPGITTALVGMKLSDHVRENLAVLSIPPFYQEEFEKLFTTPA